MHQSVRGYVIIDESKMNESLIISLTYIHT